MMLTVDRRSRLISGRAILWGFVALLNRQRIALVKDSLVWSGEPLRLLLRHNNSLIAGRVVSLDSAPDGLWAQALVANRDRGDRALALAEAGWGFSLGFTTIEAVLRGDAEWIQRGEITEISLVPKPAFP